MISGSNIDFSICSFVIGGYSTPYRSGRNSNDGGILLYIREDISSYLIATEKAPVEGFYVKLNLHNKKYLINCFYNHLATLEKFLDLHSSKYENVLILEDFNLGVKSFITDELSIETVVRSR